MVSALEPGRLGPCVDAFREAFRSSQESGFSPEARVRLALSVLPDETVDVLYRAGAAFTEIAREQASRQDRCGRCRQGKAVRYLPFFRGLVCEECVAAYRAESGLDEHR